MKSLLPYIIAMLIALPIFAQKSLYNEAKGRSLKGPIKSMTETEVGYIGNTMDKDNPKTTHYIFSNQGVVTSMFILRFANLKPVEKQYYLVSFNEEGIPVKGKFLNEDKDLTAYSRYHEESDTSYSYRIYGTDDKPEGEITIGKDKSGRIVFESVYVYTGQAYNQYTTCKRTYKGNNIEKEVIADYRVNKDKSFELQSSETLHYYPDAADEYGNAKAYIVKDARTNPVKYIDREFEYFE